MAAPVSKEIQLGAHWCLTPEGRPYFDLYRSIDMDTASPATRDAMRSAMRAGLIRWIFDQARIYPELITE